MDGVTSPRGERSAACEQALAVLLDPRADGERRELIAARGHLASCPRCQAAVDRLAAEVRQEAALDDLVDLWEEEAGREPAPIVAFPGHATPAEPAAPSRRRGGRSPRRPSLPPWWPWPLGALILVVVFAGAALVFWPRSAPPPAAQPTVTSAPASQPMAAGEPTLQPTAASPVPATATGAASPANPTAVVPANCEGGCAVATPPASCVIKGNISANGDKIYHLPGQQFYESTRIDPALGERWFCSEEEAQRAGWRKSRT